MAGLDTSFWRALLHSGELAAGTAAVALVIGWPLGVLVALTTFPGRRAMITLLALPLLLPPFLIAIGLSMLSQRIAGFAGAAWAFLCIAVPLVTCASLCAALTVTRNQADAARLAGGERQLYRLALRATFPFAALAAAFAAVMTLIDPGPGQILGWPGAAGELLITFAARYDVAMATRQAAVLSGMTALLIWPMAWKLAPQTAVALLSRDTERPDRGRSGLAPVAMAVAIAGFTLLPLIGLLRPLIRHQWPLQRAWREVMRTAGDTLLYGGLAAGVSVAVAFLAVWFLGRTDNGRRVLVAVGLALLALPSALPALWLIPWSSTLTVGLALAIRGLPVSILFAIRAVGSLPVTWLDAAKVCGVPRLTFAWRVVLPWLARWAWPAAGVATLLATAEVGTVLLLHPPGRGTLPLAIFTIMANAPEALVAMLCLLYVGLAAAIAVVLQYRVRSS